ncbi:MAG TPA: quinone-dependent dihydroorotate dehydrogenase [Magnetospirillaceae bacterium]|jgi:dihydroorotate dehydrogenase (fumarate)/dihydroorotate dehydrogenase
MEFYRTVFRPLLFSMDAERAHRLALRCASSMGWAAGTMRAVTAVNEDCLKTRVAGLDFATPIGLAAGFDKSGTAIKALSGLGFGSVEIGSVSIDPSDGNPKPRLFRLPDDRAIVVAYGVPNDGAPAIAARLDRLRLPIPLGVNLVKTNRGRGSPAETADQVIDDYVRAAKVFASRADYLMFNLSCPNTTDGRDFFADRAHLDACLAALAEADLQVPVFLKMSPLGGLEDIERALAAAEPYRFISGFMYNLPPGKPDGLTTPKSVWQSMPGAVSGPVFSPWANFCIRETYRRMDRARYAIVGAGGVFKADDAYTKLKLGASLVQMLTALIYEGPGVVRRITAGLAKLLARDGVKHVADIVGVEAWKTPNSRD